MINHIVKVYPSKFKLSKKKQLAWKIAEMASDNAKLNKLSIEMVITYDYATFSKDGNKVKATVFFRPNVLQPGP